MTARSTALALPRSIAVVTGVWLFFSALLWPHTDAVRVNNLVVGAVVSNVAFWAAFLPALRRVNTGLALWLLVATLFVFPHAERATMWHDAVIGFVLLGASLPRDGVRRRTVHA